MQSRERIILGIDPGTRILGFGVIRINTKNKPELIDFGVVNLSREGTHFLVLQRILSEVAKIIRKYRPDLIAIEAPFYGKNPQVMLKLGRAQGAAIAAGLLKDIPIFEYAPRSVKLAVTGKGSSSKIQVAAMVQGILSFECEVKYLDATDALAIALCHFYTETSLSAKAAMEDTRLKIAKSGVNASKKAAYSMRAGKAGLSAIHSSGHKVGWDEFVKSNPQRTITSLRGKSDKKINSKI